MGRAHRTAKLITVNSQRRGSRVPPSEQGVLDAHQRHHLARQQLLQLAGNTLAFVMSYNLEKIDFYLLDEHPDLLLTV